MEAILILAHGSREKQTEVDFLNMIEEIRVRTGKDVEAAFMEFSPRDITHGLSSLVDHGATRIRIIPYFLFSGVHIRKDIPEEIAAFRKDHPDLEINLEAVLGADSRLVDILADRVGY